MSESQRFDLDDGIDNDSEDSDGYDWYAAEELNLDNEEMIENNSDAVCHFETEHAAFKGNSDYYDLIRTLVHLEAQRIKAVKDVDRLEQLRFNVKNDPLGCLKKLLDGDTTDFPSKIDIAQVPNINWLKYSKDILCSEEIKIKKEPQSVVIKEEPETETVVESNSQEDEFTSDAVRVRGRPYSPSKPRTFNQPWTAEEQLRLEELLLECPPEINKNNRWRKIAQALGNRTTSQVCSRVQKYFIKLNKAGLPIPGYQLKSSAMTSTKKKSRRPKKSASRNSTFFPTQHLGASQNLDGCDEDEEKPRIPVFSAETKADIIKKIIEFKRKDAQLSPFYHPQIMCGVCREQPLKGTRWHCLLCCDINLCSDCVIDQLSLDNPMHAPSHPLEPLTKSTVTHWDPDYMAESFKNKANYLDPNFVSTEVI